VSDCTAVYAERDQLVAALSKLLPAVLWADPEADAPWRWIVYVATPEGQVSWHIHEDELPLFAHLRIASGNPWDGHATEEKYRRLNALKPRHLDDWRKRDEDGDLIVAEHALSADATGPDAGAAMLVRETHRMLDFDAAIWQQAIARDHTPAVIRHTVTVTLTQREDPR
jgi:hypothetical protein